MRRAFLAVAIALGVHAALGLALAVGLARVPDAVEAGRLEVVRVELSLAEEDVETAPTCPALPSVPARSPDPVPAAEPPPPEWTDDSLPEAPDAFKAVDFPEPERLVRTMEAPAVSPPGPMPAPEVDAARAARPVAAPRQARVDAPPRPKRTIRPHYPKGARQRGEEGEVLLKIEVSADGAVGDVEILSGSGFAELDEAAVRAARTARFVPARADGIDVASAAQLTLKFKLK